MTGEGDEFVCASCRGVFIKGWSDEKADAEHVERGDPRAADDAVVCDDCYVAIMAYADRLPPAERVVMDAEVVVNAAARPRWTSSVAPPPPLVLPPFCPHGARSREACRRCDPPLTPLTLYNAIRRTDRP